MITSQILDIIAEVTEVNKSKIVGKDRFKNIMFARHLYCHFAKEKTNATLIQIGNSINRHHSTVINSLRLISDMIFINDEVTKEYLNKIDSLILNKFQQDQKLEILLPYNIDIKKVIIYLENEYKAKCVKTT